MALIGGINYNDGSEPSVLDPTLLAPGGGAYSGGASFGGGAIFGGDTGGIPLNAYGGGFRDGGTVGSPLPRPTFINALPTAAPAPTFNMSNGGMTPGQLAAFTGAPQAPTGPATAAPPAQNSLSPLAAAGMGAPHQAPTPMAATNPYGATANSYAAPSNPLLYAQIGAQAQGAPTAPTTGVAPNISNGGGAAISTLPGVGGLHGGVGNVPPMQAASGPISGPTPFAGLVASNANGTQQGKGTQNRDNLAAQQPTRGQGLQVPPPPRMQPSFVPAPPAGLPAIAPNGQPVGVAQQPQMDPSEMKLDASTAGVLQYMQNGLNRSLINADAFQNWVKDGEKKLDKATTQYVASQVVGPQKAVDSFEQPGASGLSMLEIADDSLKNVLEARDAMHRIISKQGRQHFESQARIYVQSAEDANKIPVPGQPPDVQRYIMAQRGAQIDEAMHDRATQYQAAAYKAQHDIEEYGLKTSQAILNDYHQRLVDRSNAWDKALEVVAKRQDAFWKRVDEARKSESNMNSETQGWIKTWTDIQRSQQESENREAALKISAEANAIHAATATGDLSQKRQALLQQSLASANKDRKDLDNPKTHKQSDPEVQAEKIKADARVKELEALGAK